MTQKQVVTGKDILQIISNISSVFNIKTAKQLTSQNGIYCNRFTHLLLAVLLKTNLC